MFQFFKKRLDSQSKTLFKNSSWVFLSNLFGAGIALLKSVVIARGLGAEWYGIFTIIIVFTGTLQETLNLNLGAALIRFGSGFKSAREPHKIIALIKLCLVSSTIVALLSVLLIAGFTFFQYDTFIKLPGLGWFAILYAVAASAIFFNQISRSALRLYYKFKLNSIVQMIMDTVEFVIIVSVIFIYPENLEAFLIAVLVTRFVNSIVPNMAAWLELSPEFKGHFKAPISVIKNQFSDIRKFVIHNSVAKTLQALIKNGDILLLAFLTSDPLQVAFYTVGKKVAFSILMMTDPLVTSIYPQLCDLYHENKTAEIKKMLLKLTALAAIPATFFLIVAILFNEWIMVTVFGPEYRAAGQTFFLLTGASLIYAVCFWIQPLLQAINLLRIRLGIYVAGIIAGLTGAYFLIPLYGATGMAFSVILMNIFMPILFIYFAITKLNSIPAPEKN